MSMGTGVPLRELAIPRIFSADELDALDRDARAQGDGDDALAIALAGGV